MTDPPPDRASDERAAIARSRKRPVPSGAVFVFGTDGRVVASSAEGDDFLDDVGHLTDLVARYRQVDGLPLVLDGRHRRVATLAWGDGSRALLQSEPLRVRSRLDPASPALAVAVTPFAGEDDPTTLLRALGSVLAHELRTPLTTIYAGTELLAADDVTPSTRSEAAVSVARETERLHRIIEDLIVLVRWDIDVPHEPEPVLVHRLVGDVVKRRHPAAATPRVDVSIPPQLPPILASPPQAEHAIANLIEHAALNAPPGSSVVVQASATGPAVELQIQDSGPGRDAGDAAVAFDLFAVTPRSAGDASGANLGLVVARRLLERMGSRVWAEASGGGSTVIAFPIVA